MNEQVLAVQRMQDYIESHIEEEITMAGLSLASMFSPWHSYRLFRQYTGLTPAEYIRRLRLSQSALRLKNENCRVSDVAYALGFGSVDGYQRAFFKALYPLRCKIQRTQKGTTQHGTSAKRIHSNDSKTGTQGDSQAGRQCGRILSLL